MTHRETRKHLVEFVDDSLADPMKSAVEAHVRSCASCNSWLATYRMLEGEAALEPTHPDSVVVATYSVEPADLSVEVRAEIGSHLQQCSSCMGEYQLTRQALAESKPADAVRFRTRIPWMGTRSAPIYAAAGLVAAVLLLVLVLKPPEQTGSPVVPTEVIHGHRIIESEESLFAGNLRLAESSHLQLRAPQGVVLGDGFSVARGARLGISTNGPGEPGSTSPQ